MSVLKFPRLSKSEKMKALQHLSDALPILIEWVYDERVAIAEAGENPLPDSDIPEKIELERLRDEVARLRRELAYRDTMSVTKT